MIGLLRILGTVVCCLCSLACQGYCRVLCCMGRRMYEAWLRSSKRVLSETLEGNNIL